LLTAKDAKNAKGRERRRLGEGKRKGRAAFS
jgi:hypothetical protein